MNSENINTMYLKYASFFSKYFDIYYFMDIP